MNKFLRLVEDNLPSPNTKMAHEVLADITDIINSSKLGYNIESNIINIDNIPKFKITIKPIASEEEGEDAASRAREAIPNAVNAASSLFPANDPRKTKPLQSAEALLTQANKAFQIARTKFPLI